MSELSFIDYVKIHLCSGKGGAGAVHFRRERFIPKGGPDGGNGGHGGHVILQGDPQLSTLIHLKYRKHIKAENGHPGASNNCTGANGKNIVLKVPLGTVAKNAQTGRIQADIIQVGQKQIIMQGGQGGLGNAHFKSSKKQTPRFAQEGQPAQEAWIILELKLMADVGFIGPPNAGKSTLLATISAAKPKINNYPFTTLTPQLGVVVYTQQQSFIVADIPGLIQGAAQGKGLGIRFLKHVEHNKVLLFVIPANELDISHTYHMLRSELKAHNPNLLYKKHLLALSKTDLLEKPLPKKIIQTLAKQADIIYLSSITGKGISELKHKLRHLLYPTQSQARSDGI